MKKTLLATALGLALGLPRAEAGLVDVDWTSGTNGILGNTTVTLTGMTSPTISTSFNLDGAAYSAAPLSPPQETIQYRVGDDWTASFASPVQNPLLYLSAWRGRAGGPDPVDYTFNLAFTILSSTGSATVNGNTLSVPDAGTGFYNSILQFTGDVSALSVSSNGTAPALQSLTFAYDFIPQSTSVPELDAAGAPLALAWLAGVLALRERKTA